MTELPDHTTVAIYFILKHAQKSYVWKLFMFHHTFIEMPLAVGCTLFKMVKLEVFPNL